MSKKTTPTAPAMTDDDAKAIIASARELILEAGIASGTMYAKTREAARIAARMLDESKPLADRIKDVTGTYKEAFADAGHNVRSIFVDALTLLACASTPVSVEVFKSDGTKEEKHVSAADAVDLSKNAMRAAARDVREANGIGRKSGGGRTPGAKAQANATNAEAVGKVATEAEAFSAWLDNLEEFIGDAVYNEKIRARLIELGWTLGKAVKGKVHTKP